MAGQSKPKVLRVGDSVEVSKASTFVLLPDGSVVSARERFTFAVEGEHVIDGTKHSVQSAK